MLKDTAVASLVASPELLKRARELYTSKASPTPLVAAALFYLAVLIPLVRILKYVGKKTRSRKPNERHSNPHDVMIEVVDLHKRFKDLHVLEGISTKITRSEVVAIMGPSGSGKKHLSTLHEPPGRATLRSHLYRGCRIMSPYIDINKVRTEIGMVF